MLSEFYALGPNGRVTLIPQVLVAIFTLGTLDLSGLERRGAARWPGVDSPDSEALIVSYKPSSAVEGPSTGQLLQANSESELGGVL